jgi:hypothetical protein
MNIKCLLVHSKGIGKYGGLVIIQPVKGKRREKLPLK